MTLRSDSIKRSRCAPDPSAAMLWDVEANADCIGRSPCVLGFPEGISQFRSTRTRQHRLTASSIEYETRSNRRGNQRTRSAAPRHNRWPIVTRFRRGSKSGKAFFPKIRPEAKPEPLPLAETLRSADQKPYRGREAPSSVWTGMPAPRFL
jgi:hypothetical protein